VKRHVTFHNVVELHPWLIYVKVSSPNDPRKKKWRSTQDNKWLSLFFFHKNILRSTIEDRSAPSSACFIWQNGHLDVQTSPASANI
jgi:hypothetical protein